MADNGHTTDSTHEIPPDLDPDWLERAMGAGCEFLVDSTLGRR
jgi:hypothetical protein